MRKEAALAAAELDAARAALEAEIAAARRAQAVAAAAATAEVDTGKLTDGVNDNSRCSALSSAGGLEEDLEVQVQELEKRIKAIKAAEDAENERGEHLSAISQPTLM